MATTEHFYTGNGSTTTFAFTFPYLANSDVKVEIDNVLKTENSSGLTDNDYTISSTNIVFNSAPASATDIHIYRFTNVDSAQAVYAAGSSIRAVDLNNNQTQVLYSTQESAGQLIRQSDLKDSIINSAKIEDGSIVNADINTSAAIAGTKVTPSFGAQNVSTTGTAATGALTVTGNIAVSGTVDSRDIAADGTKLDNIETAATADQTAAEIRTLVESASDSNVFTDADHTKLNGIESGATADQTNAEIRAAVEAATDSNVFTDADHTKLNSVETGATADQTVGEIKNLIAGSPLDSSHLAANSVGDSELASTQLTTLAGMQSGTASKLADNVPLSADLADLNQLDGMAKQTTITDDDTKFPTSGAIVDYVAAQLAPIGGFEVIATDAAFPNTQPASGVVISIADGGGLVVNGSGTSTTGRTVGGSTVTINNFASNFNSSTVDAGVAILVSSTGSNQVYNYHKATLKEADLLSLSGDINDFAERYRVVNGEPTSGNDEGDLIYDKNADAIKVFDSSTNTFKLINSVGDFKFLFLCPTGGSGAPTFDGNTSTYDLRVGSNNGTAASVANAAQLIVSIDGVIQKPNAGTSAPSEGFAMVDSNTIVFGSNLTAGAEVFISQIGDEVNIGTPHDNTVSTAKIQNLAVTGDKVATNLDLADNKKIRFGTGNDLSIYHDGTESLIQHTGAGVFKIEGNGGNNVFLRAKNAENSVTCIPDGGVQLFHNNVKQLETTSSGTTTQGNVFVTGTAPQIRLNADSNDGSSTRAAFGMATGSNQFVNNSTANDVALTVPQDFIISHGSSDYMARFRDDASVELYYDGAKKFETTSAGVTATGNIDFTGNLGAGDNSIIKLGNQADLHIYHDGSNSRISDNGTGNLILDGNQVHIQSNDNTETIAKFITNGAVELYYDNSKKFETVSDGVNVTGTLKINGSAISTGGLGNVVEDTTPQLGGTLQTNGNHIQFSDSDKAYFGTGNDLQIYHSSNSSYIQNATGNLFFLADEIRFNNNANNEAKVRMFNNGAVELYYDNSKKLDTQANGVNITGNLFLTDTTTGNNGRIKLGTGADLQIYHDGANSWLRNETGELRTRADDFRVMNNAGNHTQVYCNAGAQVELYYDNSKKFETTSAGATLTGSLTGTGHVYLPDGGKFVSGAGSDLQMYHDGSHSRIADTGTGFLVLQTSKLQVNNAASNEEMLTATENGAVELYYDNSKKFETASYGCLVTGNLGFADNDKVVFGAGSDLKLWHDGSNSYIQNVTGALNVLNHQFIVKNDAGNETIIQASANDDVRLYFDNSTKLWTTSWGATVGGDISGNVVNGLSNYQFYAGFAAGSTSTFGGVVLGSGVNGNSPFVAASKAGNGSALHLRLATNGSTRMLIQDNGNIGAPSGTNIYNASDSRLKKNVTTLDKGLETIKSLRPVSFNWIDGFCDVEKDPLYGFIAQEVETVDSNLVSPFGNDVEIGDDPNNPDQVITDPLRVNEKFIIPMLVKAVQELSAKVAALEAK